jgi:hypothetical protein
MFLNNNVYFSAELKNPPSKKVDFEESPYKGPKLSRCCSSIRS